MYMFNRRWCWPGTISAGPPGPSAIDAWSSAATTSSCRSEPASLTAASQSFSPRYMPEHALPAVNIALPGNRASYCVEQRDAERVGHVAVVVEAAVQPLDLFGRDEVEEVLVEVGAHDVPAPRREAGLVQPREERRQPGRHDRVEHDLGAARHDVVDEPVVVHVVEREVLLAHDRATAGRHDLPHLLVHDVRPDVVGRRHVEALGARSRCISHGKNGSICCAGTGPVQKISGWHSWPSYCSG